MFVIGLLVAVLLALHGLAAGSAISAATCCKANITIAMTSTITLTCPETAVFDNGNRTLATGFPKTSANSVTTSFASGSVSTHISLGSTLSTAKNATGTNVGGIMTTSAPGNTTLPQTKMTTTATSLLANSAARPSPPGIFTLLLHLFSYLNLATAQFAITTVRTTTMDPLTTITATPTGCAFHPDSQECMSNLGFNNAGVRHSPPFVAALLANLVPVNAKRAETTTSSSTVTVTITVLRNQGNDTAVATSTETEMGSLSMAMFTSMGSSMNTSSGLSMTMSCFPFCNASGGIVATDSAATPLRSSPGSGSTPSLSVSGRPAASGGARKGGVGGVLLVGGVVVGLL